VMALRGGYDKLRKETGWEPNISWEDGVRRTIGWYAANRDSWLGRVDWLTKTDMAVVVSSSQNEIELMAKRGLDIKPHRERMVKEDLDEKFKAAEDPLRLVFVCAMWITGFDVPTCSTVYIDKPMKNHTLMQTIARANRVWREKQNGLIVDYVGIFRNLQKALAIYGKPKLGRHPVKPQSRTRPNCRR